MITITMWELLFWGLLQAVIIAIAAKATFKNIKLVGPLIMWHSKKGLKWIESVSKRHKRLWEAYGDLGILLAFGFVGALYVFRGKKKNKRLALAALSSLFLLAPQISSAVLLIASGKGAGIALAEVFLAGQAHTTLIPLVLLYFGGFSLSITYQLGMQAAMLVYKYAVSAPVTAMVGPALPGINVEGSPIQNIPWYGWLTFPILIVVHELSHGILARVSKIKVKSTGVVLFGLLPFGAFVEPDEKQLEKAPVHERLRVFSVGSTANYLTAFLTLAILLAVVQPALVLSGVGAQYDSYKGHPQVVTVSEESDAYGMLEPGMNIAQIDGVEMKSVADINAATQSAGAGSVILVSTDGGAFSITLNSDAKIGITLDETYLPLPWELEALRGAVGFLGLVVFFNFVVGVMNLLPAYPLDGGFMLQAMLETKTKKKAAKRIVKWISIFIGLLFVVNLIPLFIR